MQSGGAVCIINRRVYISIYVDDVKIGQGLEQEEKRKAEISVDCQPINVWIILGKCSLLAPPSAMPRSGN